MKLTVPLLSALALLPLTAPPATAQPVPYRDVKYVIMMVPDGMGLANVTATRIRLNGISGHPLNLETLPNIGYQRTYSEQNTVTDSSAAASAFACGEKFVNNEVCFHADGRPYNPTLLELAKARGMATGLVATQTITHATPASFGSHVPARKCETEIARQYILETQPDVLLGGGQAFFRTTAPDPCGNMGDYISAATSIGYTYADTITSMQQAVSGGAGKLLGLFASKNLTPEYKRLPGTSEPRLPDMTSAALSILERNATGFFLMVEGSLIDSGNHEENLDYQTGEMAAFDQSVGIVLNWINARPERKEQTVLVVIPDHETGGFAIIASETPGAGLGPFTAAWSFVIVPPEKEAHHTGTDVVVWSQGPGTQALSGPMENTFPYFVVRRALGY
jgi:alkaline phosphatase